MIPFLLSAIITANIPPAAPDVPVREPQMAVNGSTVALTYGAGRNIFFSSSRDNGRTFSSPVKVAEAAVIPLNRHRGPRIVFAAGAIVITAVVGSKVAEGTHAHGLPSDGDLLSWRSMDNGKTWSKAKAVNDVPAAATEGLHALASDGKSTLAAAWLDKRGPKGTRLFTARSTDGGLTWSKNVAAYESPDGTICECCHPSLAIDATGKIHLMWRNALDGARDMYMTTSANGEAFSKPSKLGNGTWPLKACPMDGGGLAIANGKVVTAWRRDGKIFLAEPGQPEQEIGTGKDVALAINGKKTYAVWTSGTKLQTWVNGKVEELAPEGGFASVAPLASGGALVAWEQSGAIQIRQIQ